MKKMLICLLMLAICCGSAVAESGRIDDRLFNVAKQTLFCIDTGDYHTASTLLGCIDTDSLRELIETNLTTVGSGAAQTRISVAFYYNDMWYLAVPTAEPADPMVEALLLVCGDGMDVYQVLTAYWGNVQNAMDTSEAVIWNEEYVPGVQFIGN